MKPIKIAMLSSVSVHANNYLDILPNHPMYDFVAMSLKSEERPRRYGNAVFPENVKVYETDEEVFKAHPDLDAVVLAGANHQSYEQFLLCVKYGIKNVLTMKVPTFSMEEYSEMQRLARKNGMVVQVELEMRYKNIVRRIKEVCDSGKIGKILSVQINNTTVCVLPVISPWVTDPEESYGEKVPLRDGVQCYRGGCLTDHPHAFDLARYFTGSDFESVYAEVSHGIRQGLSVEESVFVLGKMKNGVVINIDPSYSRHENEKPPALPECLGFEGYPKRVEVDVVINGEKGSIVADCFHTGVYYIGKPHHNYAFYYVSGIAHYTPSLDEFANAVNERRNPLVSLDVHRNTIEVVRACYESIYTGETIYI